MTSPTLYLVAGVHVFLKFDPVANNSQSAKSLLKLAEDMWLSTHR